MLRAERDLARARLAAEDGDETAPAAFASAIAGLRDRGTPSISPTVCSTTPGTN